MSKRGESVLPTPTLDAVVPLQDFIRSDQLTREHITKILSILH